MPFDASVSGPKSCTCSEEFACSANEENEVDLIFGVMKVNLISITCNLHEL